MKTFEQRLEEAKEVLKLGTQGPVYVLGYQPSVTLNRASDGKMLADVDTWFGKGCFDADIMALAYNLLPELIKEYEILKLEKEQLESEVCCCGLFSS